MVKGGYQILDLKNVELTSGEASSFPGSYETIEGTRKAILVSGLNIGGTEYHDMFVNFVGLSSTYYGIIEYQKTVGESPATGTITIAVSDSDEITATIA